MGNDMSVIVEDLTKTFGDQCAVDHISFAARPGEILGFLGPNGAGKSTTMKMATGFLPPGSGKVTVAGHDVTEDPLKVRKKVGYLPEHNPLYQDMYVREHLAFVASLHGLAGKKQKQRVGEMIERTGLAREQHKKISQLSKGYRQRVGLALAMIHDPEVLIFDEPTSGLDPNQIVEIRELIRDLSRQRTVILSTHIMQEVQALCQRVVIINEGRIVADESVKDLLGRNADEQIIQAEFEKEVGTGVFGELSGIREIRQDGLKIIFRGDNTRDLRSAIFKIAADKNLPLLGLTKVERSLETIFQELTKNGGE